MSVDEFTSGCVRKSRAENAAEKWRRRCRRFEDVQCEALMSDKEAKEKMNTNAPDHRIAIIADVQCADHDDAWNFHKTQKRYYRHALRSTASAVKMWNTIPDLDLIMQLGDLIDGRNSNIKGESERILEKVHDIFKTCKTKAMEHLIGNHELYNFDLTFMQEHKLLQVPSPSWHVRDVGKKWRFVMLDAYVVSTLSNDPVQCAKAWDIIGKHNHNIDGKNRVLITKDFKKGMVGTERRFVPYNGALGDKQLDFLKRVLTENTSRNIILFSHIPTFPGSSLHATDTLLLDYEDVLKVIRDHGKGLVAAFIAGHYHQGGYAFDPLSGTHHITIASPLETPPPHVSQAILELYDDCMLLHGSGLVRSLALRTFVGREREAGRVKPFHLTTRAQVVDHMNKL